MERMTKREVINTFDTVISINYCAAQTLLKGIEPIGVYYSNATGWKADIYVFEGVAIVTGYQPFGNVKPSRSVINRFEEKARFIVDEWNKRRFPGLKHDLNECLHDFIKVVAKS